MHGAVIGPQSRVGKFRRMPAQRVQGQAIDENPLPGARSCIKNAQSWPSLMPSGPQALLPTLSTVRPTISGGNSIKPKPRHTGVTKRSRGRLCLTWCVRSVLESCAVWPVGQFTVRHPRDCARYSGLSNGCTQSYPQDPTPLDLYKKPDRDTLTNTLKIPPETADHNLTTPLQAPPRKAFSQVHPTYSQPVPQ